ncbi:MAG TPA: hypothetical protein VEQ11_15890 [Chloroflexota bacterium]|nr:hypothetical protein [Chloroflexota bacterium]
MALETRPAWVVELKQRLSRPCAEDELVRLQAWAEQVSRINDDTTWLPGTFERLLDLARAEAALDE